MATDTGDGVGRRVEKETLEELLMRKEVRVTPPISNVIVGNWFSFYDAEEIKRLAVTRVHDPDTLDHVKQAKKGGLYDPALGISMFGPGTCATCHQTHNNCPGHLGYIQLPLPVYHPLMFSELVKLLRAMCMNCGHFRLSASLVLAYTKALRALAANDFEAFMFWRDEIALCRGSKKRDPDDSGVEKRNNFQRNTENVVQGHSTLSHAVDERRTLLRQFYSEVAMLKKCARCDFIKSVAPVKIFQQRMGKRVLGRNTEVGYSWSEGATGTSSLFELSDLTRVKGGAGGEDGDGEEEDEENESKKRDSSKGTATKGGTDSDEENAASNAEPGSAGGDGEAASANIFLPPTEVMKRVERLFSCEQELLAEMFGACRSMSGSASEADGAKRVDSGKWFFYEVVPVPPNRFRPPGRALNTDALLAHPQNTNFTAILKECRRIGQLIAAKESGEWESTRSIGSVILDSWLKLQEAVNMLIDTRGLTDARNNPLPPGVRQLLDRKSGLFRLNMMGKRVNHAGRSVISPDPYLRTCEVGVPLYFAKNLEFREKVTAHNVRMMHKLIKNGPSKWPGCSKIEIGGRLVSLLGKPAAERIALANRLLTMDIASAEQGILADQAPVVYRHLMNGDYVIMNRQPTLHKPSMMAFQTRVIDRSDRVLRMHYANCKTFNADFDGDEMNMHFPQSHMGRTEAATMMFSDQQLTCPQYIVPTNGQPLRGLIQDHVVSAVLLSKRDSFFTRERASQLLFACCYFVNRHIPLDLGPPALLKPKQLWTGKQIITALLKHITANSTGTLTLECKCKIPAKLWCEDMSEPGEHTMIVRDNELLSGVLDKSQIGNSKGGIVHGVHELFGPTAAGDLLSCFSRLFTDYLQYHGFTCGIDDLILQHVTDEKRSELLGKASEASMEGAIEFLGASAADHRESSLREAGPNAPKEVVEQLYLKKMHAEMKERLLETSEAVRLDQVMKGKLNNITSSVIKSSLPGGLSKRFPQNNLALVRYCFVRVGMEKMASSSSRHHQASVVKHFTPSPQMTISGAKGSEVNVSQISCCLGQQVLEGRRVPITVAGKSLPSFDAYELDGRAGGYIVDRFLTGIRPQEYYFHCMAGREGLVDTAVKTSNSGYLQRCLIKHLEGLCVAYDMTVRSPSSDVIQFYYGDDGVDPTRTSSLTNFEFLARNQAAVSARLNAEKLLSMGAFKPVSRELDDYWLACMTSPPEEKPDPPMNVFNPATQLGAVSERFQEQVNDFLDRVESTAASKNSATSISPEKLSAFLPLMYLKFVSAMTDPGDSVGLLASQSIGEPSTQMTLNTFHLAGHGGANVTLGIPRLREIIMTASAEIQTPAMEIPFHEGVNEAQAKALLHKLQKVILPDILESVAVEESVEDRTGRGARRYCTCTFELPSMDELQEQYGFSLDTIDETFYLFSWVLCACVSFAVSKGPTLYVRKEKGLINRAIKTGTRLLRVEKSGDGGLAMQVEADPHFQELTIDEKESSTVVQITLHLTAMQLSPDEQKLLLLQIVEQIAKKIVVQQTKGINRCMLSEKKESRDGRPLTLYTLITEGSNIEAMHSHGHVLDLNRIVCNDIARVLTTYGVEAGRANIVQEIKNVFGAYGITVDPRHLSLLADYMTQNGQMRGLNRSGMGGVACSPWQAISFEASTQFLKDAAMYGAYDDLSSPSASLVLGQPVRNGTGAFEVYQRLSANT